MPALPSWLADPLFDQFAALLPPREMFVATHPWGCHRRRIADRIVFDKLISDRRRCQGYGILIGHFCASCDSRFCECSCVGWLKICRVPGLRGNTTR